MVVSHCRCVVPALLQGSVGWFLENTKKVALLPINENKSSLPNPKTTNIGTAPRELKSPPPPHGLLIHTHLKGSCRRAHWVSRISLVKEVEQRTAFLASSLRIVCCFRITIEIRFCCILSSKRYSGTSYLGPLETCPWVLGGCTYLVGS